MRPDHHAIYITVFRSLYPARNWGLQQKERDLVSLFAGRLYDCYGRFRQDELCSDTLAGPILLEQEAERHAERREHQAKGYADQEGM